MPPGLYFVLGDRRYKSEDSRHWSFGARYQIRGRPWFVYYSSELSPSSSVPWLSRVLWVCLGTVIR